MMWLETICVNQDFLVSFVLVADEHVWTSTAQYARPSKDLDHKKKEEEERKLRN